MSEYLCTQCGESKRENFYDGVRRYCKGCAKKRAREHREKNLEKYRERDRQRNNLPHRVEARKKYAATQEGREAHNRAQIAWTDRNTLKRAAHIIVGNAIRDKKLFKQPCEHIDDMGKQCGALKVEAHHDDYTKPLEVRWLCKKHHDDHTWKR